MAGGRKNWYGVIVPVLLLFLLTLTVSIRLYPFLHGQLLGPDSYYHATVIRDAVTTGVLSHDNPLARCPWGVTDGSPVGMYLLPFILAPLMGAVSGVVDAMVLSVLLFAVLGILSAFLLQRRLFSTQTALIGSFLLAASYASIQRSAAFSFRGEHLALPFLFLSLYWLTDLFSPMGEAKSRRRSAVLSGAAIGLTAFIWNGFPVLIGLYLGAGLVALVYLAQDRALPVAKGEELESPPALLGLSVLTILIFSSISGLLTPQSGVGGLFVARGWMPLLVLIGLLALWTRSWGALPPSLKRSIEGKGSWLISIGIVLLLLAALILSRQIGAGFFGTVSELQPTRIEDLWGAFGVIFAVMLPGIFALWLRLARDEKSEKGEKEGQASNVMDGAPRISYAIYLGWLVASVLLTVFSRRFIFLAALPFLLLAVILLEEFVKNRTLLMVIVLLLLFITGAHALERSSRYLLPMTSAPFVEYANRMGEFLPDDACVVSMWDLGSLVQWHTNVSTYTSSVGGQDFDRIERTSRFFLSNQSFDPGDEPGETDPTYYFLIREDDLLRVLNLAKEANVTGLGLVRLEDPEVRELGDETVFRYAERIYVTSSPEGAEAAYIGPEGQDGEEVVEPLALSVVTDGGIFVDVPSTYGGCVYVSEETYFFNKQLCETNMIQMLMLREIPGLFLTALGQDAVLYGPDPRPSS